VAQGNRARLVRLANFFGYTSIFILGDRLVNDAICPARVSPMEPLVCHGSCTDNFTSDLRHTATGWDACEHGDWFTHYGPM
jgi:hypothetical protein